MAGRQKDLHATMSRSITVCAPAAALLLLVALLPSGADAINVNGGKGCRFVNYREVNTLLREAGETDAAVIDAVIARLATVNFYLCKSCKAPMMAPVQNVGAVVPGLGECWCAAGYGSYTQTVGQKTVTAIGCNKCPGTTTTVPTSGPYNPTARKWTNTPCA